MASADYRLCDRCGAKTFYDANLGWDYEHTKGEHGAELPGLGDWAVLCVSCSLTHTCIVVERVEVHMKERVKVDECPEGVRYCSIQHVKDKP